MVTRNLSLFNKLHLILGIRSFFSEIQRVVLFDTVKVDGDRIFHYSPSLYGKEHFGETINDSTWNRVNDSLNSQAWKNPIRVCEVLWRGLWIINGQLLWLPCSIVRHIAWSTEGIRSGGRTWGCLSSNYQVIIWLPWTPGALKAMHPLFTWTLGLKSSPLKS